MDHNIQNNKKEEQPEDVEVVADEDFSSSDFKKKFLNLKEELTRCEARQKEYLDGWQRAKADHINYKNEEGKRFEDMARFVTTGFVQDILPVLDSFDLAFHYTMPPEIGRGVLLIRSQFEDILKRRGVEEIAVEKNEIFNPERHESIGEMESDAPEGKIAEVVQRGYLLRGKIVRAARVRLSKGITINNKS